MTRRSIVAMISIFVHVVVVCAAMTADWWRPITQWPTPREALAYVADIPRPVHLEDIELPKPAKMTATAATPSLGAPATTTQPIELAPVRPPDGISDETRREGTITGRRLADIESPGSGNVGPIGPTVALPTPPPTQAPVRLHSGIRAPQRVVYVTPVYPPAARLARVEGMVIIEATIDERGNVARAQLLRSIPLLDDAALTAVRQWKFTPTLLNNVAVPIVMTVTVNFKLD
jgi:TonB family protein